MKNNNWKDIKKQDFFKGVKNYKNKKTRGKWFNMDWDIFKKNRHKTSPLK
tara:strand:+ start:5087 stop:5236 length:150 start_codon:yes stop_codon:yes gene_type:complete